MNHIVLINIGLLKNISLN